MCSYTFTDPVAAITPTVGGWISGFADGEGCFCVTFSKRSKFKLGLEVRLSFSLSQHMRSLDSLRFLAGVLGVGFIRFSRHDRTYKYEVRDRSQLNRVIQHFIEYPLRTAKARDFELFVQCHKLLSSSQHLNPTGLRLIIDLAYSMNSNVGRRKYSRDELLKMISS